MNSRLGPDRLTGTMADNRGAMTEPNVRLANRNGIAILTLDNPPVNALSHALRLEIYQRLTEVEQDPGLRGLVIACAGKTFVAGADISELGKTRLPGLRDIIEKLEGLSIPSVAAIHGTALGGGFELALGCTFRVADKTAKIGLPEVKLGLLPGAGGTIRATYLAGAEEALSLAGGGEMISSDAARGLGLVDAVCLDAVIDSALHFLEVKIRAQDIPPPVSQRADRMPAYDLERLNKLAAQLCRNANSSAPMLTAKAIQAACQKPFAHAMKIERDLFLNSLEDVRSTALRHLFFAERSAAKPRGDVAAATERGVQSVGLVGAGEGRADLAMALANSGFDVVVQDPSHVALRAAENWVNRSDLRPGPPVYVRPKQLHGPLKIDFTATPDALADCDFVLWSHAESVESASKAFARLAEIAKPGAILAIDALGVKIDALAEATERPADVCGVQVVAVGGARGLVEINCGLQTAPDVLKTSLRLCRRLNKQAVISKSHEGPLASQILASFQASLKNLALEGVGKDSIDRAFQRLGWADSPFEVQASRDPGFLPQPNFGLGRGPTAATAGADLICDSEIIERTLGAMIVEGQNLIRSGSVARRSDIDVIWVHGLGFPRDLGGLMFWDDHNRPRVAIHE